MIWFKKEKEEEEKSIGKFVHDFEKYTSKHQFAEHAPLKNRLYTYEIRALLHSNIKIFSSTMHATIYEFFNWVTSGGDAIFAIERVHQVFPNLAPDAPPEEELSVREARYWGILKSGHTRFMAPLAERRDVLSAADYLILFQNLDELLKISEEVRDEGGGVESYLCRVARITAAYRRYLSGLQRACCLLVALRRNTAFAKLVCEPAVPHKRRPDLTGVLLLPLEHYRCVEL